MKGTMKEKLSAISLIAAIGFGAAGTFIDPKGVIHPSMLYLIAQLLIFSATILGFGEVICRIVDLIESFKRDAATEKK